MSKKGIEMPPDKELLREMKKVHMEKCLDYLDGKRNRVAFRPKPPMRRKKALELVSP